MNYNDLITFLASNPSILAIVSLLALWPLLKGLAVYGTMAWQWFFGRFSIDKTETELASQNTNYLIATLAWYALLLVAAIWLRSFLSLIGEGLETSTQTSWVIAMRWLNSGLTYLTGLLSGVMVANIGILALEVRKAIKKINDNESHD